MELTQLLPIFTQCSISIPLENVRKHDFLKFQEVQEHNAGMKWAKTSNMEKQQYDILRA